MLFSLIKKFSFVPLVLLLGLSFFSCLSLGNPNGLNVALNWDSGGDIVVNVKDLDSRVGISYWNNWFEYSISSGVVNDDEAILVVKPSTGSNAATIKIPVYKGRMAMTAIPSNAFRMNMNLVGVDLSKATDLKILRENAFKGCVNLKTITLPSSLAVIEQNAFSGCVSLTTVEIGAKTPPALGRSAFGGTALTEIRVPSLCD